MPNFPQEAHGPYTAFLKQVSDSVMAAVPVSVVPTGPGGKYTRTSHLLLCVTYVWVYVDMTDCWP